MIFSRDPLTEANGIKRFTEHSYYWGINSREEMQAFLSKARTGNFEEEEARFWEHPKMKIYANQWHRADFLFCLPLSSEATVLDLGSGYGNNTIPLARYYKRVVAADATHELLEYNSLRAASEGIKNIDFVNIDPLEYANLPFAPKSFDAIIVSGLLEWIGPGRLDVPPNVSQQKALDYLKTLLKDDGILYVAIENRWFPGFFLRDPHSKLKYTAILPRPLADRYARAQGHTDGYRTYIYSSWSYRRMFKKAGFLHTDFYFPYPNYRNPGGIFSDEPGIQEYLYAHGHLKDFFTSKWTAFLKCARFFGLHTFFLSSFMMISSTRSTKQSLFIIRKAREQGLLQVLESDLVIRIIDASRVERAHFLAFHAGEGKPYGHLFAMHNPKTEPEKQLIFEAI